MRCQNVLFLFKNKILKALTYPEVIPILPSLTPPHFLPPPIPPPPKKKQQKTENRNKKRQTQNLAYAHILETFCPCRQPRLGWAGLWALWSAAGVSLPTQTILWVYALLLCVFISSSHCVKVTMLFTPTETRNLIQWLKPAFLGGHKGQNNKSILNQEM